MGQRERKVAACSSFLLSLGSFEMQPFDFFRMLIKSRRALKGLQHDTFPEREGGSRGHEGKLDLDPFVFGGVTPRSSQQRYL